MEHDETNVTKIWLKAQAAQLTSINPGNDHFLGAGH
jgi:hypothetical protein